jgi:hypothetical protein
MIVDILLIFALVMFVLAGLGVAAPRRLQWIGWGLAAWMLVVLLSALHIVTP